MAQTEYSKALLPLLKVEHLSISWKGESVLEDVSFEIQEGERVCIFGRSGVGKTTLFHAIAGLTKPDVGKVLLGKAPLAASEGTMPPSVGGSPKDIFEDMTGHAGKISYMFQDDLLLEELTVEANCALSLLFADRSGSRISKKAALKRVRSLLPSFGLGEVGQSYPKELSGGMRQRAALLRTSLAGNRVVLMDEPFSALDTFTKQEMIDFFIEKADASHLTTLFISHNLEEAEAFGTRSLIFAGNPQAGTPSHLIADVAPSKIRDFLGQLNVNNTFGQNEGGSQRPARKLGQTYIKSG